MSEELDKHFTGAIVPETEEELADDPLSLEINTPVLKEELLGEEAEEVVKGDAEELLAFDPKEYEE